MLCQLCHRAFAHPLPLPGMPFLQVSSWLSPHFPRAAHFTREDFSWEPHLKHGPSAPFTLLCLSARHLLQPEMCGLTVWLLPREYKLPKDRDFYFVHCWGPRISLYLDTQWALSKYWMNEYWVSQDYMTLQLCTWAWRNSHFCKPTSLWASGAPKPGSIHSMNQTAQMDGFLLPLWSEWLFSVMGLWQSIALRWRDGFQIEGLTYSTSLIQVPPTPTPSWNYSVPVKTFKSQNGL